MNYLKEAKRDPDGIPDEKFIESALDAVRAQISVNEKQLQICLIADRCDMGITKREWQHSTKSQVVRLADFWINNLKERLERLKTN